MLVKVFTPLMALIPLLGGQLLLAGTTSPTTNPVTTKEIQESGAFGFPQSKAKVLCDTPDLRVSVWNNTQFLYLQAIVWTDSDDSGTEQIADGRIFGDQSAVSIDVDADGKPSVGIDRTYFLNPLSTKPGLNYVIARGQNATTALINDSLGRGAIRYFNPTDGGSFRVDSYLIPLAELGRAPGDEIRIAVWAFSIKPKLNLNSLRIPHTKAVFQLPLSRYQSITLSDRTSKFDSQQVPEDRNQAPGEAETK